MQLGLLDCSRKSQISNFPSDLPINKTPGLVGDRQPHVIKASAVYEEWKIGLSIPCHHNAK